MSHFTRPCFFICLLVVCLQSSHASSGSFRRPVSNSDERITEIQNDLVKVQSEILGLNAAVAVGGQQISPELKLRLSTLEGQFQDLKQQLSDERRESSATSGKYDEAIINLTNYYNTLDIQLKALQKLIEDRSQSEASRRVHLDIADAIRSHRFEEAQETILKTTENYAKIPAIVHEVYSNSPGNIALLFDFAKALGYIRMTSNVLRAIKYEMKSNGHRDPYKLMELAKLLKKEVIDLTADNEVMQNASADLREINIDIVNVVTENLKAAMYSNNYQNNVNVENLANAIHLFNSDISDEVMRRVIGDVFPNIVSVTIADNIYSNTYISQIVCGLVELFQKLKRSNSLNNRAVLTIADYISRIKRMKNYDTISLAKKSAVQDLIDSLPTCARSLFFLDTVCIWNRGVREYLYAAGDGHKWNRDRRSIFTWGTGEAIIQGDWQVEKTGDLFYFRNKAHANEYMYAAGTAPYDNDRRYVLTWMNGGTLGNKSAWNVELSGDYCYLKNEEYKEYLYAAVMFHSSNRRYVFTWKPGTSVREEAFQWQIRSC